MVVRNDALDIRKVLETGVERSDSGETLAMTLMQELRLGPRADGEELIALVIQLARDADAHRIDVVLLEKIWRQLICLDSPSSANAVMTTFGGGLGFLIGSLRVAGGDNDGAKEYLCEHSTLAFINRVYGVPRQHLASVSPFKSGDTSLILTCGQGREQVLKLLHLKYLNMYTLSASFAEYRERYVGAPSTPCVHACGQGWILMDRAEGKTLREYIDENLAYPSPWMIKLRLFSDKLLAVLDNMARVSVSHYDLSPDNIMVSEDLSDVSLINFGKSNVLTQNVGDVNRILQAQTYASPELLDGNPHPVLSDVYSFGAILLECCVKERLTLETMQRHLDTVWRERPDLAMIIDDCLTRSPAHRALEYRFTLEDVPPATMHSGTKQTMSTIYRSLQARIKEVLTNSDELAKRPLYRELISSQVFSGNYVIDSILKMTGGRNGSDRGAVWRANNRKMELWKRICIFASSICVVVVPFMIFAEGLDSWPFVEVVRDYLSIEEFSFMESLPGRLVCVSFAITAAVYYINIFQSIDIYDEKDGNTNNRSLYKISRFWMRFNSCCFAFPILWAEVVDPRSWPYCAALGLFFVGMNNYFSKRAAKAARASLDESFRVAIPGKGEPAVGVFTRWDRLVFYYAIGLVGIGVFLWYYRGSNGAGIYQVEIAFSALVILINYFKMYKENCIEQAPEVRKMLMHIFLSHKRMGDANLLGRDLLAVRLRTLYAWLESQDGSVKVDSVLIVAEQRADFSSLTDKIRRLNISVNWCGADDIRITAGKLPFTTIVLNPKNDGSPAR